MNSNKFLFKIVNYFCWRLTIGISRLRDLLDPYFAIRVACPFYFVGSGNMVEKSSH